MKLFKSNPEKAIQREIESAKSNRERLHARLAEADQAAARHSSAAREAALSGDDAGLDAAEASLRASQGRTTTLRTALSELDQRIVDLEREQADMADRKVRSETAAEVELLARKLTEAGAEFNAVAERFASHTALAVPVVFDALGLDRFMAICRAEVPATLDLVVKLLRAHADDVIAGRAPATLPQPNDQVQVPAPAPTPDKPHFTYRPAKAEPTYKGFMG